MKCIVHKWQDKIIQYCTVVACVTCTFCAALCSHAAAWAYRGAQNETWRQQRSRHAYCRMVKSRSLQTWWSYNTAAQSSARPTRWLQMNARYCNNHTTATPWLILLIYSFHSNYYSLSHRLTRIYYTLLSNVHIFIISLSFYHSHTYSGIIWTSDILVCCVLTLQVWNSWKNNNSRVTQWAFSGFFTYFSELLSWCAWICRGGMMVEKRGYTLVL